VPALEDLVRRTAAAESRAPAVWLHVQAPRLSLRWQGGAGPAANPTGQPAPSLRIASNTKTFVAAAVLRLVEDDALDLDTPLARLSPPATVATLRAAGYDVDRLTPLMLLQHTGGLRDYATLQVFLNRVSAAPAHRWTRAEQLQLAMDDGPPLTLPGAAFHYSDTGYILLGEVIETVTGQSMPRALAELLVYRRLGIKNTWFETLEPEPAGAPARTLQLFDEVDAARFDPSTCLVAVAWCPTSKSWRTSIVPSFAARSSGDQVPPRRCWPCPRRAWQAVDLATAWASAGSNTPASSATATAASGGPTSGIAPPSMSRWPRRSPAHGRAWRCGR
jgi:CubicO group peptidase (beta-lactamase class C family)